jgi:hypothetical protein
MIRFLTGGREEKGYFTMFKKKNKKFDENQIVQN